MDPKLQDRLPPPGGGRKKKVSLAVDTAGHNSLSAAPQGSLVVTDNSLRDSSISVGLTTYVETTTTDSSGTPKYL